MGNSTRRRRRRRRRCGGCRNEPCQRQHQTKGIPIHRIYHSFSLSFSLSLSLSVCICIYVYIIVQAFGTKGERERERERKQVIATFVAHEGFSVVVGRSIDRSIDRFGC